VHTLGHRVRARCGLVELGVEVVQQLADRVGIGDLGEADSLWRSS
jgi:hypothetical protein